MNVANTWFNCKNLFNTFFLSMGTAASVLVGRALGAEDAAEAKACTRKIIFFNICLCIGVGMVMFASAPFLPMLYKEADSTVRALSRDMIRLYALASPFIGFANCSYFILRAGGRTMITFLFDSAFAWIIPMPLIYSLIHFTDWTIIPVYAAYHSTEFIKDLLGFTLIKKGVWIRNIVSSLNQEKLDEKD